MRAKALLVLLGATAFAAYTAGRHSSSVNTPVAAAAPPRPPVAKSVAFTASVSPPVAAAATSSVTNNPAHTIKAPAEKATASHAPEKAAPPEIKRKLRSH
ncbi:hypothetical protein [Bradyrhizobium paxllaeri]|uniref:hypothetical protein n=1 Tax=Bradyrhizobium paxllaeri TaxID=190148 RepID=UPI001147A580|nr:hypothetical protein [Bradyrhizobium paxllaeri]